MQQQHLIPMPQVNRRDPNLDHPGVKKYRELIHLQANWLQREFIADAVDETDPRCLRIWEATLLEHMGHGWNPKDVLMMLKNYKVMMDNIRVGANVR
jgi:hypothetical protein